MKTTDRNGGEPVAVSPLRLVIVFAVLFAAYQLPKGLGMRMLHSMPVLAALMRMFARRKPVAAATQY